MITEVTTHDFQDEGFNIHGGEGDTPFKVFKEGIPIYIYGSGGILDGYPMFLTEPGVLKIGCEAKTFEEWVFHWKYFTKNWAKEKIEEYLEYLNLFKEIRNYERYEEYKEEFKKLFKKGERNESI